MTLHYDKNWCKIYYHEDVRCIRLVWDGFATSMQFREACNYSIELMEKKKAKYMIADNVNAKVVSAADQQWMGQEWFPKAYNKGYQRLCRYSGP